MPPTPSSPPLVRRRSAALVTAAVIAALIALLAGGYFAYQKMHQADEDRMLGYVLREEDGAASLHEVRRSGLAPASVAVPGALKDFARAGEFAAAIVQTSPQGTWDVVRADESLATLATGFEEKRELAVSGDGATIAYAALTGSDRNDLASWTVQLVDMGTGSVTPIGNGYAPQFSSRDGVAYIVFASPTGIATVNLSDRTGFITPFAAPRTISRALALSEDGSTLALRDPNTNLYTLFDVTAFAPLAVAPRVTFAEDVVSVSFRGLDLYGIAQRGETAHVVAVDVATGAASVEADVPAPAAAYKFIP